MSNITTGQIMCIRAMLAKLHLTDQKAAMVSGLTGGRTESLKELSVQEGTLLIRHLKTLDPEEQKADTMRRKIIYLARCMHWETPEGKADMQRIDGWMLKYSHGKKKLSQYQYKDLPRVLDQFEQVYKTFVKSL